MKYTSYPLVNAVLVKGGTQDLALDVASVGQVAEIHATPQVALVEPVEEETPADGALRPDAAAAGDAGVNAWGVDAIRAPEAWAMGATGAGITVANLDSGVQFDHAALVSKYRGAKPDGTFDHDYNWMATRTTCSDAPCDDNGHGTHTMGTMVGDDGINHVGVAPGANWIATDGCCSRSGAESLLASGWWLLAPTDLQGNNPDPSKRPHVINNSWGQDTEHDFHTFFNAIDEAWTAAGIFSVWSSGNTSPYAACDTVSSPGAAPGAYSVGAYDVSGNLGAVLAQGRGRERTDQARDLGARAWASARPTPATSTPRCPAPRWRHRMSPAPSRTCGATTRRSSGRSRRPVACSASRPSTSTTRRAAAPPTSTTCTARVGWTCPACSSSRPVRAAR